MIALSNRSDPKIIPVTTPQAYITAGQKLMQKLYAEQQEKERIAKELSDFQAQCAALFSAG